MKFLYIPPTHFYYNSSPPCPLTFILRNHIFSWESKLKHMAVDIMCFFFQDVKSSLTKQVFNGNVL